MCHVQVQLLPGEMPNTESDVLLCDSGVDFGPDPRVRGTERKAPDILLLGYTLCLPISIRGDFLSWDTQYLVMSMWGHFSLSQDTLCLIMSI